MQEHETKNLSGEFLNMAVEIALGYGVSFQADLNKGIRYDKMQKDIPLGPVRNRVKDYPIDDILDLYRISTEVAGDGWSALLNDCFCDATHAAAFLGSTRREAALRCFVHHKLGGKVVLPV